MANNIFSPGLWADSFVEIYKKSTAFKPITTTTPVLPEDVRALLAVASAEYEWSPFTLAWLVRFKTPGREGYHCDMLVDQDQHTTLEQWADFCIKVKEQMEAGIGC